MNNPEQTHPKKDYRQRFTRRPILFWWQAFALIGFMALLFLEIPFSAISHQALAMSPEPLPSPTAFYVTLDPDYAAQLLKRSLAAWMTGQSQKQNTPGLDLSALDFGNDLRSPDFLEQSGVFANDHRPLDIPPLPVPLAAISIPPYTPPTQPTLPPKPAEGLFIEMSPSLTAVGFTFPTNELKTMKATGECRFYVETDDGGEVIHALLLTPPPSTVTPLIERALMRGRVSGGVTSGIVTIRRIQHEK